MEVRISRPRADPVGLEELEPLWHELHLHHRAVADYPRLVGDLASSWTSRLRWYRDLLAQGASYVTATDHDGRLVGYAMVALAAGPDDTFEVDGGIAELVTLVVAEGRRSLGAGRALLAAAEDIARDHGFDTVKIAVMRGNSRAQNFYEASGYAVAEHVLFRHLEPR
jgi:GNAT superfamily N-acetyltransferase